MEIESGPEKSPSPFTEQFIRVMEEEKEVLDNLVFPADQGDLDQPFLLASNKK
jgi:hypothetical protein